MSKPRPWKDHETVFLETLNKASSRHEANIYVHECIVYFYKAGYTEDEIERAEVLMKKAVKEWAHTKYNIGTKPTQSPKLETEGGFFDIRYFNPLLTYTVEIVGEDATWVQHRLRQYTDNMVSKRHNPEKGRLSYPRMTVVNPEKINPQ